MKVISGSVAYRPLASTSFLVYMQEKPAIQRNLAMRAEQDWVVNLLQRLQDQPGGPAETLEVEEAAVSATGLKVS